MSRRRAPAGFTLIEILATIVLIAIVMPVVMKGISIATQLSGNAKRKSEAALLGQSKLNEVRATRAWRTGAMNGTFGDDHPEYRWTAELLGWDTTSALKQLDLRVYWTAAGREQSVTFTTLVDSEAVD